MLLIKSAEVKREFVNTMQTLKSKPRKYNGDPLILKI